MHSTNNSLDLRRVWGNCGEECDTNCGETSNIGSQVIPLIESFIAPKEHANRAKGTHQNVTHFGVIVTTNRTLSFQLKDYHATQCQHEGEGHTQGANCLSQCQKGDDQRII